MKNLKNKRGFTLVELLAVIVILALIMAIAIYSISGILQSSRSSAFKDTAAGIIRGTRLQLTSNLKLEAGQYYVTPALLESGATNPPFGGEYQWVDTTGKEQVATGVYKASDLTCSDTEKTFVTITRLSDGSYEYRICLTAGDGYRYIDNATEQELLGSSTDMIKPTNS